MKIPALVVPSDSFGYKKIQIRSIKLYNIILMSIRNGKRNKFNAIPRLKRNLTRAQLRRLLSDHFSNQRSRQLMCPVKGGN